MQKYVIIPDLEETWVQWSSERQNMSLPFNENGQTQRRVSKRKIILKIKKLIKM